MAILNWSIDFPDQAADVNNGQCRLGKMVCSDSLGAVVTPGYLNAIMNPNNVSQSGLITQNYYPLANDQWLISGAWGSALFQLVISGSVLSLIQLTPVFATFSLTASQFNGMYATPVSILAAPGSGNLILLESMLMNMAFGTMDFAAGGVVAAQYGNTVHGGGPLASGSLPAADFFAAANSTFIFAPPASGPLNSVAVNGALYISNATQAFTTGDSTFTGLIKYRVVNGY